MPITKKARERLHQLMEERRLELNLTWRELAARAGISYEAIRGLWTGSGGIRTLTARNLDRALEWQPGSVERVASGGGDPVPQAPDDDRPADLRFPDDGEMDRLAEEIWNIGRVDGTPRPPERVLRVMVELARQDWERKQDTPRERNGAPAAAAG